MARDFRFGGCLVREQEIFDAVRRASALSVCK